MTLIPEIAFGILLARLLTWIICGVALWIIGE